MRRVIAAALLAWLNFLWKVRGSVPLQHCLHHLSGSCKTGSVCSAWRESPARALLLVVGCCQPCVRLQTYIDFEISEGNRDRARKLYERLLARTKHVKVCTNEAATSSGSSCL